jgi:hypothetical protein
VRVSTQASPACAGQASAKVNKLGHDASRAALLIECNVIGMVDPSCKVEGARRKSARAARRFARRALCLEPLDRIPPLLLAAAAAI